MRDAAARGREYRMSACKAARYEEGHVQAGDGRAAKRLRSCVESRRDKKRTGTMS